MNATSFQVLESFVRSSPKHDEPWSKSPVVSTAQIRILLLAGMVPLPWSDAISPSAAASDLDRTELFPMRVWAGSHLRWWLCDSPGAPALAELFNSGTFSLGLAEFNGRWSGASLAPGRGAHSAMELGRAQQAQQEANGAKKKARRSEPELNRSFKGSHAVLIFNA